MKFRSIIVAAALSITAVPAFAQDDQYLVAEDLVGAQLRSSDLNAESTMGGNPTNQLEFEGEAIGEVQDVALGMDGRMLGIIVRVGGPALVGGREVMVPVDELEIQRAADGTLFARTGVPSEQLEDFAR